MDLDDFFVGDVGVVVGAEDMIVEEWVRAIPMLREEEEVAGGEVGINLCADGADAGIGRDE